MKMYTVNAAYAINEEKVNGSLEVGKKADITVIDKNPYEHADKESIYEMNVVYTIKEGQIIFEG